MVFNQSHEAWRNSRNINKDILVCQSRPKSRSEANRRLRPNRGRCKLPAATALFFIFYFFAFGLRGDTLMRP